MLPLGQPLFENERSFDIVLLSNLFSEATAMRRVLKTVLVLGLVYLFALIGLFTAMCQTPEVFSTVMSKTPNLVFLVFPFKPMWLYARKGELRVGEQAPDFSLEQFDKKATVQLSALKGKKPVVLVFGSYT
jgi:hypothetical protein